MLPGEEPLRIKFYCEPIGVASQTFMVFTLKSVTDLVFISKIIYQYFLLFDK